MKATYPQYRMTQWIDTSCNHEPASHEQAQQPIAGSLFCDMKTDENKANFFLSGRGYETGVIAKAIQNDVAMAYQRCANYAKQAHQPQAQAQEPFGYFRPDPFGWTDCAPTDEGAIPLYEHPTGRPRPLDPNALSHAINVMPWRDEVLTPDRLREFGAQLWLQFCADPVAKKQGGQGHDELRTPAHGASPCAEREA